MPLLRQCARCETPRSPFGAGCPHCRMPHAALAPAPRRAPPSPFVVAALGAAALWGGVLLLIQRLTAW